VFENRVLRKIFGPKTDEVTRYWKKLHNEDLNDHYSSLSIVRVIKWRRMRWVGYIARMGVNTVFWWGNLRERGHWGDPGADRGIILRWTFRKWDVAVWTESNKANNVFSINSAFRPTRPSTG